MDENGKNIINAIINGQLRTQTAVEPVAAEIKRFIMSLNGLDETDANATEMVVALVCAERSRFDESGNTMAIAVYLYNPATQHADSWVGELSDSYGTGNNANKTRRQMTIEALQRVGVEQFSAECLYSIMGKSIPVWVKQNEYNGKTYWRIGSIGSIRKVVDSVPMSAIFGSPATAPAAQVATAAPAAPAATVAPANPFPTPQMPAYPGFPQQNPFAQK